MVLDEASDKKKSETVIEKCIMVSKSGQRQFIFSVPTISKLPTVTENGECLHHQPIFVINATENLQGDELAFLGRRLG